MPKDVISFIAISFKNVFATRCLIKNECSAALTYAKAIRLTKARRPIYFANYIQTNFQHQNMNVIQ